MSVVQSILIARYSPLNTAEAASKKVEEEQRGEATHPHPSELNTKAQRPQFQPE